MLNTIENTKGKPVMQTPTDAGEQKRTVPKVVADWFHDSVIRGRKEVFTDVVTLTPDMARLLLAANHENRVINKRAIQTYVDDIKSGRWALNGESIKVATDGSLNDGQQRAAQEEAAMRDARDFRALRKLWKASSDGARAQFREWLGGA